MFIMFLSALVFTFFMPDFLFYSALLTRGHRKETGLSDDVHQRISFQEVVDQI